jgi:hypothetical protein
MTGKTRLFLSILLIVVVLTAGFFVFSQVKEETIVPSATPLSWEDYLAILPERIEKFKHMLEIVIKLVESKCYEPGKKTPNSISISFRNKSRTSILLNKNLLVDTTSLRKGGYNIFPKIQTFTGHAPDFGCASCDFWPSGANPNDFVEIAAEEIYDTQFEFAFPDKFIGDPTIVEGYYLLSFTYANRDIGPLDQTATSLSRFQYDWNAWVGEVESNQIEICIQNP